MSTPPSFLWGAATSAHQVEGNTVANDWWAWELNNPDAVSAGLAVDHYKRFKEDFGLAKRLGHNAHRLSLEWSRIEPQPGKWNRAAIEHYREVLAELRKHSMKTFITLHHFTVPKWFAEEGSFENKDAADRFARYAAYAADHLHDLVDFWVTVNEPMVLASEGYWHGRWPPQKKSLASFLRVTRNLAKAHIKAYRGIHRVVPQAQVGIAKHVLAYRPAQADRMGDRLAAALRSWWFNHRFFSMTGDTHDFIGVNYYRMFDLGWKLAAPFGVAEPWKGDTSDMGWPIRPEGLTLALLEMKRYGKPIYITENGLADEKDDRRADFIRHHLRAVEKAQQQGADVRGYFHWSLLDNFEWAEGFAPKFGLIEVNRKTQERKIRKSAYAYRAIIEQASGRL